MIDLQALEKAVAAVSINTRSLLLPLMLVIVELLYLITTSASCLLYIVHLKSCGRVIQ